MPGDDPSSSHSLNPQPHSVTSTWHHQTLNTNSNSYIECSSNDQNPPSDVPPIVEHLQSLSTFPNTNLKHEQGHEQPIRNSTSDMPSDINAFISMHGVSRNLPSAKEEEIKSSSMPSTSSSQHKIHLAAVPTQELSSRSIISLDPKLLGNDSILSSSSSKIPLQPTNRRQFLQPLVVRNSLTDTKSSSVHDTKEENKSSPQQHLLHQEQSSNNLLACDATLLAHQKQLGQWKNIANLTFVQSLPDTVIQSSTVVKSVSTRKRNFDTFQSSHKCVKVMDGKSTCSQSTLDSTQTLVEYFENLLESRGYSTKHYCSLETGYHCKPTDLQKASYGMKFIEAVRTSNEFLLKKLLDAGLSPNPCNNFGESILHMICRRGDHKLLKIFLDYGSSIQICDDFGRTPLHDACWTSNPCFKIVELLMNKDRWLLHIVDCRGSTPLNYVKKENWQKWKQFLDGQKDVWWPPRNVAVDGEEEPPKVLTRPAHSVPLPDPIGAPSCEHARAIANGIVELDDEDCLDGKQVGRSLKPSVDSPRPETVAKQ